MPLSQAENGQLQTFVISDWRQPTEGHPMPRFGKGKPMDVQARAVLKGFLELSSRHAAKQAQTLKGSRQRTAVRYRPRQA